MTDIPTSQSKPVLAAAGHPPTAGTFRCNLTPSHDARLARGAASHPSVRIPRVLYLVAVLSIAMIGGHIITKAIANLAQFNVENGVFPHD